MALFLEQKLLVAGDALREFIGSLVGDVKRGDGQGVDSGKGCRHRLCLAAQQVDVGIIKGLVETRGDGMEGHLAVLFLDGLVLLGDLRPEHAGGAELGKLHEVVGADTHVELHALGDDSGFHTGLGQQGHPLRAPSQGVAEFLEDIAAGVVEHHRVDGQAAQTGHIGHDAEHSGGFGGDSLGVDIGAMAERAFERVIVDRAIEHLFELVGLKPFHEGGGQVEGLAGAGVEIQLHLGDIDVFEEDVKSLDCRLLDGEAQGVDPFSENIEGHAVGLGGVCGENLLAGEPVVVVTRTPHIRELAREGAGGFEIGDVLAAVHRLHRETLIGSPHQFLVEGDTLEIGINLSLPGLVGDGRELGEQFFFIFCHDI